MTPNPVRITVDKGLRELTALMSSQRVRRVPILACQGKVIGMVTLDDLLVLPHDEMPGMAKTIAEAFLRQPVAAKPGGYHHWPPCD